MGLVTTAI